MDIALVYSGDIVIKLAHKCIFLFSDLFFVSFILSPLCFKHLLSLSLLLPQYQSFLPFLVFLLCVSLILPLFPQYVSLSIQCDFTHPALWWHSLPLLSGSSPSPRLQVKSILTHRPQGPNWTVTEFLQPRWAPTTKLRINGWGARAGQKNQCLFIQTWQSRRPSNSLACFSRRCVILFFFFSPCRALSSAEDKMCALSRGWNSRWCAVAILSSICSHHVLKYCMGVNSMPLIDRLSRKQFRLCWADVMQTTRVMC